MRAELELALEDRDLSVEVARLPFARSGETEDPAADDSQVVLPGDVRTGQEAVYTKGSWSAIALNVGADASR